MLVRYIMSAFSGGFQTAVYVLGPLLVSTVFGAEPEFCEQSRIYNGLMMEQLFETPYDVLMKTVKVDCYVTCILSFKHIFMAQKLEMRCEKKPLFCLKFSLKNFILPKIAFKKNLYFQKSLLGGLRSVKR